MIKYVIEYEYFSTGSLQTSKDIFITRNPKEELKKLIDIYAEEDSFFGKFLLQKIEIKEAREDESD